MAWVSIATYIQLLIHPLQLYIAARKIKSILMQIFTSTLKKKISISCSLIAANMLGRPNFLVWVIMWMWINESIQPFMLDGPKLGSLNEEIDFENQLNYNRYGVELWCCSWEVSGDEASSKFEEDAWLSHWFLAEFTIWIVYSIIVWVDIESSWSETGSPLIDVLPDPLCDRENSPSSLFRIWAMLCGTFIACPPPGPSATATVQSDDSDVLLTSN